MRGDTSSPQIDGSDEAWSEIETLVDETAKLARMPMSPHAFHGELVKRLVQTTNARSAAVWCRNGDGRYTIDAQVGLLGDSRASDRLAVIRFQNVIEVAHRKYPSSLLPRQAVAQLQNPTDDALVLQPALVDEQIVAVIETYHEDSVSPTEAKNREQLVAVFADFIADFHRSHQLRELVRRRAEWSELEQFVEQVHRPLDLKRVAFVIANEAIRVTNCDRVTVFQLRTAGCRTLSISGLDTFDRRSTQVRAAEHLAKAVAASDEPLWHAGEVAALPPQLELRLQAYLDASPVRSLAAVPLGQTSADTKDETVGVLLFERFDNIAWDDSERRRIDFVCRHASIALHNASELAALPLIGASKFLLRCLGPLALHQLPKTAALALSLTMAIVALVFVPADFNIRGQGQLMPTHYRHVFAPADGVIQQLNVHHAESVSEGTTLMEMRRPDLEYEEARLLGDILTNQKRLDSVRSALLNHRPGSTSLANEYNELTSEEARLRILLASLRSQQAILERERAELMIASPIDGEVMTWGIEDALSRRPVRRGELLLSIADPKGPWQLDLRIADHDIEHVLAARTEFQELHVGFIVTSHSGEGYRGKVQEIAMATELDEHDQPTVLVRVAVDREQLPDLRPGASVVANIHCGRRSIGYVWLRELFDVIKTRLLF
ncbi:MAG TPA: GAF domain-containing protein [Pirellulaceae bacterium]|nr:GAF domain-containing protein [Pirellulaceae bacterium]